MKACIDLCNKSITSEPHGMFNTPLRQAANGHFLMPLYEIPEDLHVEESQLAETMIRADVCLHQHEPNDDADPADSPTPSVPMECPGSTEDQCTRKPMGNKGRSPRNGKITTGDRRRAFQHIAKNTKNGVVDVQRFQEELKTIYGISGSEVSHAMIAYKPKLERIPNIAADVEIQQSVLTLTPEGEFSVSPWSVRPAGSTRSCVPHVSIAMFTYRPVTAKPSEKPDSPQSFDQMPRSLDHPAEPNCYCCSELEVGHEGHDGDSCGDDIEVLYEEMDWLDINTKQLSKNPRKNCFQPCRHCVGLRLSWS